MLMDSSPNKRYIQRFQNFYYSDGGYRNWILYTSIL